jgi:hypothetical protein
VDQSETNPISSHGSPGRFGLSALIPLLTPFAALVALLAASGTFDRVQRDAPVALVVAIALVLLSGVLLAMPTLAPGRSLPGAPGGAVRWLFPIGIVVALLGLALAVFLAVADARERSRPQITAAVDEAEKAVTAAISASDLSHDDRLIVNVDLQTIEQEKGIDDPSPFAPGGSLPVERAVVGPGGDGVAEHELAAPILSGGIYTHVVIEAKTSADGRPCIELPDPASADEQTACAFIPLYGS